MTSLRYNEANSKSGQCFLHCTGPSFSGAGEGSLTTAGMAAELLRKAIVAWIGLGTGTYVPWTFFWSLRKIIGERDIFFVGTKLPKSFFSAQYLSSLGLGLCNRYSLKWLKKLFIDFSILGCLCDFSNFKFVFELSMACPYPTGFTYSGTVLWGWGWCIFPLNISRSTYYNACLWSVHSSDICWTRCAINSFF